MPRLWRLATGNWSASPGRTAAIVLSVALGVGTVVIITSFYETTRRAITEEVVDRWLGSAHITVHPPGAHWGAMDASLTEALAELDNVRHVTARLQRRMRLIRVEEAEQLLQPSWWSVDAIGVDPESEQHFRTVPDVRGRMIRPGERGVALIEQETAETESITLGDTIVLMGPRGDAKTTATVIGLFDSRRVARFQHPTVYLPLADLQETKNEQGLVTAIDIMLNDPSPDALTLARRAVEGCISKRNLSHTCRIETAAARQMVIGEAERITRLMLVLMALVAMLTSFFIILTTQSMSLMARRSQLGVMRCVGTTRAQLAALLLGELMPVGLVGTLLGVALGIAATHLAAYASQDVFIRLYLSPWGIGLAAASGIATTLLSTLALIVQVTRVTPLEAVNPEARPARLIIVYLVTAIGVALLALHQWMVHTPDHTRWLHPLFALAGTGTLYLGYACITPGVMIWIGRPVALVVARLLGLCPKLAEGPFRRAPWRSTGACWVLMVGLSLIVYFAVWAEAILAVWDFPARLPDAFVWSPKYVPGEVIERVRQMPGVGKSTTSTDLGCKIDAPDAGPRSLKGSLTERFLRSLTRPVFVAGDPDELFGIIKVAFTEGSRAEALEKLKRGGYVLIPAPTSRNENLHVGDRVTITIQGKGADFEVAGVVQSPALDLAVTAFQAESYMQIASASAILGTRSDLKEKFGLDVVSMFMFDVDLPPSDPPPDFDPRNLPDLTDDDAVARAVLSWADELPNERATFERIGTALHTWLDAGGESPLHSELRNELRRFARALRRGNWDSATKRRTREEIWDAFRERLVLLGVARGMDRPDAIMGSLRRLRQQVDTSLRRAIVIMTWLPSIVLAVAAIGIGNLMMVSVHVRSREIAVLRAIGAQKLQIIRLVLAEAVTLGLLGSVIGLALGLHAAASDNHVTSGLTDVKFAFIVPIGSIALSVALTGAVCLLAGIIPARYAARNNIIAAMQTT